MYWEEKVNLVKKKFSDKEFTVPHVDRKNILRQIETVFIKRDQNYFDLNNNNSRFSNWWDGVNLEVETIDLDSFNSFLDKSLLANTYYWAGYEFSNGEVWIYKAKKQALIYLCSIGQTWSKIFHIIDLKFNDMISFKILDDRIQIKKV